MHGSENYRSPTSTWGNSWMPTFFRDTTLSVMEHLKHSYRFVLLQFSNKHFCYKNLFKISNIRLTTSAADWLHRTRVAWDAQTNFWIRIRELVSDDLFWICSARLCHCIQRRFAGCWYIFLPTERFPGATHNSLYEAFLPGFPKRNQKTQTTLHWRHTQAQSHVWLYTKGKQERKQERQRWNRRN